jgi:deoxyribodipyrimidine photo-lyase
MFTRVRNLEQPQTHDGLWNAARKELLRDRVIHGYYCMYWGKKIIERSASHQEVLDTLFHRNDRYAVDGRDSNTHTNILWCFGLHNRPWSERPIFRAVRNMFLEGMKDKKDVEA